jgi:transcriptional regulator with XRE-family HTH domain
MATKWKEIRRRGSPAQEAEDRRWVERELVDMSLRELREFAGKTQTEVAEELEKVQAEISQFENRPDHVLSKLREYVQALGGELEVVARFGDKTLRLRGV